MIQLRVVIFFSLWSKVRRCKSRVSNKEKYPPKKLVFLLSFWRRTKDKSSRSVTLPATLPNLSLVYHLNSISTLQRIFIRPWFLFFFLIVFLSNEKFFQDVEMGASSSSVHETRVFAPPFDVVFISDSLSQKTKEEKNRTRWMALPRTEQPLPNCCWRHFILGHYMWMPSRWWGRHLLNELVGF